MADFDDELLAMIGDDSDGGIEELVDDAGGHSRSPSPAAARSPTPEPSPPRPSTETSKPSRRGIATKGSSKGMAKRQQADQSEEEGEMSSAPGSPTSSLGSGAMEESDSDVDPVDYADLADDGNAYPLEGKYKDSRDKQYVLGLTEVEREQVLAEREEEAQAKRRDTQLKSLLDTKDREAEKTLKKRKAGADLEDSGRSTRPKTKRGTALDAYTRQREQAKEDGRRRVNNRGSRRSRSHSGHSSQLDADGESDDDYARPSVRKGVDPEVPADLTDVERIRVGRSRLAKVCFFPKFEETMIGCFVRVCIGQDRAGVNTYRMAVIKGFKTSKPYLVDASPASQPFYTDQYVNVAHGSSVKEWPYTHCSDSKFNESEFERWKKQIEIDGVRRITRTEANKICTGIHGILDHHLTSQEITDKINKQNKFKHMFAIASSSTPKKSTLGDDAAEKMRIRNEKIRKQNADEVRKALVAEKSKARQGLFRAQREHAARKAAAENGTLVVPKSDFDGLFSEGSDISRTASPAVGMSATPAPPPPAKAAEPPKKRGIPTFAKMAMDDDIIGSMDLAIDIDI